MAHLTDMEELINNIDNPKIREYMREALKCYMSGAYRGCIVLSYIALFDDLVDKLGELAYVNSKAKELHDEIKKRQRNQDVYENYLVDQLKANNLLPEIECNMLKTIKDRRNKSAHPSGHMPSAEEARFIYYECISKFISKPKLVTTLLADEILIRMENMNFFPSREITSIVNIVQHEINELHPSTYPYLIEKLTKLVAKGNSNSVYFLYGLSGIKDNKDIQDTIRKYLIISKSDDTTYRDVIIGSIYCNPSLMLETDDLVKLRIKKFLNDLIANTNSIVNSIIHPAEFLHKFASSIGYDMTIKVFNEELQLYVDKLSYITKGVVLLLQSEDFYNIYVNKLISKARSSDFDVANGFVDFIKKDNGVMISQLKPQHAFEIIVSIISAAERGAWDSQSIRNGNFNSIPLLKQKGKEFFQNEKRESIDDILSKYYLGKNDYNTLETIFKDE